VAKLLTETPGSLSYVINEYLKSQVAQGKGDETIKHHRQTLRRFMQVNGNILFRNVREWHVTNFFQEIAVTRGPSSLNVDRAVLNSFFEWGRQTRRFPLNVNPMWGVKTFKVVQRERQRVHVSDFPRLLDAAEHPRDRVVIALGLYQFLRQSEMKTLTVGRVDLKSGTILVDVHKTKQQDLMPISAELDEELRRWFEYYTWAINGPLHPELPLIPQKTRPTGRRNPETGLIEPLPRSGPDLDPSRRLEYRLEVIAQEALKKIDFPVKTVSKTGRLKGEGIHTLRRSGARAWFDYLQSMEPWEDPRTGELIRPPSYPIRPVQAALHHKQQSTTERYIGLEPDRYERDLLMRGRRMYDFDRTNVIELSSYGRIG